MRVSLFFRRPDPSALGSTEGAAGYFIYRVTPVGTCCRKRP